MATIKDLFGRAEVSDPLNYFTSLTNKEIVQIRILENDSRTKISNPDQLRHLIHVFSLHRQKLADVTRVMNNFTKWQGRQLQAHLQMLEAQASQGPREDVHASGNDSKASADDESADQGPIDAEPVHHNDK